MSFARFGVYSDVYVFDDVAGGFACLRCKAAPPEFRCATAQEMALHLREHQRRGDKVPAEAILELEKEAQSTS